MKSLIIGRTYMYNGENHTIAKVVKVERDLLDVFTDKRRIRVTPNEMKQFLPVDVPANVRHRENAELLLYVKEQNKPMDSFADKLNGLMDKVEAGTIDIKKAKVMNEIARSVIHLRKGQIELLKVIKG